MLEAEARLRAVLVRVRGTCHRPVTPRSTSTRPRRPSQRAMKLGENGDLIAKLDSMIGESTVHSLRGDLETAVPIAMQCTADVRGDRCHSVRRGQQFRARRHVHAAGQVRSAKIAFERSNEVAESSASNSFRPSLLAYMRANSASLGAMATNGDAFKEALAHARTTATSSVKATIIWKRGRVRGRRR